MLSRTASELFWMARYLERAESYARVLDVTWKLSMIPRHSQQSRDLALPLNLSLTHELFQARHARFTMSNLLNFFALDGNNPCSIYSCVEMAWNNAHAVRGSLSAEVWECINATRIELRQLRQRGISELGTDGFFEWVKERVHLFRGAVLGTLGMVDYYGAGVLTVFIFYFFHGRKWWCLLGQLAALYWVNVELLGGLMYPIQLFGMDFELCQQGLALLALVPIWLYRGRQGYHSKPFQYACYAFYPVHMLLLVLVLNFVNR